MAHDLDLFDEEIDRPIGGPQAGIVVVATANFVVGLLLVVAGVLFTLKGVSLAPDVVGALAQSATAVEEGAKTKKATKATVDPAAVERVVQTIRSVQSALAMVAMIFGGCCLGAGVGVLMRHVWGRLSSLMLGFGAGVLALVCLVILDLAGLILYGAYALTALLILFDKDYSRQFR